MVMQHYRWDFIGLSTDQKPTPETSEKVVDGSTFYCSDTSKLYVFCKDTWYEKVVEGGGGGTSYTAGDGIDITDDVIKATNTGKAKVLTTADYNANSSNWDDTDPTHFNCVAMWKLDPGYYTWSVSGQVEVIPYKSSSPLRYINVASALVTGVGSNGIAIIAPRASITSTMDYVHYIVVRPDGSKVMDETFVDGKTLSNKIVNDLTTTSSGKILDARQGKVLKDLVDSLAFKNAGAPTTATVGTVGQLLEDTTNGKLYICTAVTPGTDPDPDTYTWVEVGAGGSGAIELTSNDYNWPTDNPDGIALWLLDTGVYEFNGIKVYASGNDVWSNSFTTVGTVDKGNNGSYFTFIKETNEFYRVYVTEQAFTVYAHVFLSPASSAGNDTTLVMSQRATTSLVYDDPVNKSKVRIGGNISGNYGVQIGFTGNENGDRSVSIGHMGSDNSADSVNIGESSRVEYGAPYSVALGSYSYTTMQGQVDISTLKSTNTYGYNNSQYRLLTGLYDGQSNHDGATVAQGNKLMTTAPTTTDAGVLGQLWTDTTAMHTYQLTAIDTTDPDNPLYTWTQRW